MSHFSRNVEEAIYRLNEDKSLMSLYIIRRYIWRNQWLIALEVALLAALATFIVPGGGDLEVYYLQVARGCLECGYVPYFAYWFLWPLAFLPASLTYFVWTTISLMIFLSIVYHRRTTPLVLLLSFPAMAQMWVGQIDGLVALGLALVIGLFSQSPIWRGVGLVLAFIKPQLSLLPVMMVAWQSPKEFLKMLPVPLIAAGLSFLHFGLYWPLEWLALAQTLPTHMYRQTAELIFPYGLVALGVPFLLKDSDRQLQAAFVASAFIPQYSSYSYVVFLAFMKPLHGWMAALSFIWLPFYPLLGSQAHVVQILFPIGLLIYLALTDYQDRPAG